MRVQKLGQKVCERVMIHVLENASNSKRKGIFEAELFEMLISHVIKKLRHFRVILN